MSTPIMACCVDCQNPYSARLVDGDIILPTNDGCCECGASDFEIVTQSANEDGTTGRQQG